MNKLNKAIKILETYGFEFVDDEKQANIVIKTKPEIKDNKAFYKVIKAVNSCRTQIELVTLTGFMSISWTQFFSFLRIFFLKFYRT